MRVAMSRPQKGKGNHRPKMMVVALSLKGALNILYTSGNVRDFTLQAALRERQWWEDGCSRYDSLAEKVELQRQELGVLAKS